MQHRRLTVLHVPHSVLSSQVWDESWVRLSSHSGWTKLKPEMLVRSARAMARMGLCNGLNWVARFGLVQCGGTLSPQCMRPCGVAVGWRSQSRMLDAGAHACACRCRRSRPSVPHACRALLGGGCAAVQRRTASGTVLTRGPDATPCRADRHVRRYRM